MLDDSAAQLVHAKLLGTAAPGDNLKGGCGVLPTENSRVGWISADDIAAVAARALTDLDRPNGDLALTGAEALSSDDVAARIGRT